jgi:hypothetical protein
MTIAISACIWAKAPRRTRCPRPNANRWRTRWAAAPPRTRGLAPVQRAIRGPAGGLTYRAARTVIGDGEEARHPLAAVTTTEPGNLTRCEGISSSSVGKPPHHLPHAWSLGSEGPSRPFADARAASRLRALLPLSGHSRTRPRRQKSDVPARPRPRCDLSGRVRLGA